MVLYRLEKALFEKTKLYVTTLQTLITSTCYKGLVFMLVTLREFTAIFLLLSSLGLCVRITTFDTTIHWDPLSLNGCSVWQEQAVVPAQAMQPLVARTARQVRDSLVQTRTLVRNLQVLSRVTGWIGFLQGRTPILIIPSDKKKHKP